MKPWCDAVRLLVTFLLAFLEWTDRNGQSSFHDDQFSDRPGRRVAWQRSMPALSSALAGAAVACSDSECRVRCATFVISYPNRKRCVR